jgi:hypothetical protein
MNKKTTIKTALVDTELLLYRHAASIDAGTITFKEAVWNVETAIKDIISTCGASEHQLLVSGPNNFRKALYPCYKANRPPKPTQYYNLSETIKANHQGHWQMHPQLEADDLLGIMATNGRTKGPIICSIDKDMLTVPCWHYQWHHDDFPHEVTQEQADTFWLKQLLMGDPTDGIEGMKGKGPKKAEAMMEGHRWETQLGNGVSVPDIAKYIYEQEGFSVDEWRKALSLITIWKKPFPPELLENELIASIVKTIPSLNTK